MRGLHGQTLCPWRMQISALGAEVTDSVGIYFPSLEPYVLYITAVPLSRENEGLSTLNKAPLFIQYWAGRF